MFQIIYFGAVTKKKNFHVPSNWRHWTNVHSQMGTTKMDWSKCHCVYLALLLTFIMYYLGIGRREVDS